MFDIATMAVANTAALHLKNANGEYLYAGTGDDRRKVEIVFYGPGSSQYAEVEARQTARAVKRMQENDGKFTPPPPEVRFAEQAEDLATITAEFRNFNYSAASGAVGTELFRSLYADKSLGFIPPQALKFVADWGNFKVASATS